MPCRPASRKAMVHGLASASANVADDDLLRRIRAAVGDARAVADAPALVDAAWDDAVADAKSVLQAVFTKALLEAAADQLNAHPVSPGARPPTAAPAVP